MKRGLLATLMAFMAGVPAMDAPAYEAPKRSRMGTGREHEREQARRKRCRAKPGHPLREPFRSAKLKAAAGDVRRRALPEELP